MRKKSKIRYSDESKPVWSGLSTNLFGVEGFALTVIEALTAHICVLDETGTIIAVNRAWLAFADENPPQLQNGCIGVNYLAVCDGVSGADASLASAFADGIRGVMERRQVRFDLEYACHSPDTERWFVGHVTGFDWKGRRRVVVAHENITERKKAEQERAILAQRIIAAQEGERRRIALDLHDQSGHALVALQIALKEVGDMLPQNMKSARSELEHCRNLTAMVTHQIRHLSQSLHPPALGQIGLCDTLRGLCAELSRGGGVTVRFQGCRKLPPLPVNADLCLYRVLQEALTNVSRHAHARRVHVRLRVTHDAVRLMIEDDGSGFDPAKSHAGLGLDGMRERMRLLGGALEIRAEPGRGTRVEAICPVASSVGE